MTDVSTGAAPGYRVGRTLSLRVEWLRQVRRVRTRVTLGLLVAVPLLLLLAFELGTGSPNRRSGDLVDLGTSSGLNFVTFAIFSSANFLFVVVVALFFGDTVASEASWSSLKYLLAIPVPRSRLLRQKAIIAAALSLLGLLLLPLVALGVGVATYGGGELVTIFGEALPFETGAMRLFLSVCFIAVQLTWVAGLALLLSVVTDAPLGAVGGTVLVSILSQILDSITALGDLRMYLPTHYSMAFLDLLTSDPSWKDISWGAFSALAYGTVFILYAARRFARKDVTS
ncbi:ABC transporter permease [Pseudonocardiaceae bacterium YIM PH 21723]|nr:ABC transporter permease [Pseudonocardiaceae bacterium YIM PH 21723]